MSNNQHNSFDSKDQSENVHKNSKINPSPSEDNEYLSLVGSPKKDAMFVSARSKFHKDGQTDSIVTDNSRKGRSIVPTHTSFLTASDGDRHSAGSPGRIENGA